MFRFKNEDIYKSVEEELKDEPRDSELPFKWSQAINRKIDYKVRGYKDRIEVGDEVIQILADNTLTEQEKLGAIKRTVTRIRGGQIWNYKE